jgi:hypothetical protein
MHEDLLGYLLGALEPHEMRRVAQWLRDDPAARAQLDQIERSLKPLEESLEPIEPPPSDLVSRTLASLPPLASPVEGGFVSEQSGGPDALMPMQSGIEAPRNAHSTWLDWIGGATAAAVVLGLLLPTLAEGRFESRKIACQDQLRQLGTAITQFVNRNQQDRLPAVAEAGPEAFAGMYAVRLHGEGLLSDPSLRWCPSLDLPGSDQVTLMNMNEIASVDDLHRAPVDLLLQIQRFVGGHYAYTLGVMDHEQLTSPRFESRSSFAVMSDAPLAGIADRDEMVKRIGHSGAGINVLFEDGRVKFIQISSLDSMPDHPLLNHRGEFEAGVNVDDASLAPSWRPPFINVRQR